MAKTIPQTKPIEFTPTLDFKLLFTTLQDIRDNMNKIEKRLNKLERYREKSRDDMK